MHEAQLHPQNSFLTLTYDDEHLPSDGGLRYQDFQLFMRYLRRKVGKVRFYMCGEYGERTLRPHYHAALFGFQFSDLSPLYKTGSGSLIYSSALLSQLWSHGHSSVGELTRESAAYIARYVIKKISGPPGAAHYSRVDAETGEIHQVTPEFTRMSLKPGIGAKWIEKYHSDVYPSDKVNSLGRLTKPPRYYDNFLKGKLSPDTQLSVATSRYGQAILLSADNTANRLRTRERLALAKNKLLKRSLE